MKSTILLSSLFFLMSCGQNKTVVKYIEGTKGDSGQSCLMETRETGNFVVCPNGEFQVSNGADGVNGSIVEIVEVCPQYSGNYVETLLKVDNRFMAFYSEANWKKQRLSLLPENQLFETTDGRGILFTVLNGEIICQ